MSPLLLFKYIVAGFGGLGSGVLFLVFVAWVIKQFFLKDDEKTVEADLTQARPSARPRIVGPGVIRRPRPEIEIDDDEPDPPPRPRAS